MKLKFKKELNIDEGKIINHFNKKIEKLKEIRKNYIENITVKIVEYENECSFLLTEKDLWKKLLIFEHFHCIRSYCSIYLCVDDFYLRSYGYLTDFFNSFLLDYLKINKTKFNNLKNLLEKFKDGEFEYKNINSIKEIIEIQKYIKDKVVHAC